MFGKDEPSQDVSADESGVRTRTSTIAFDSSNCIFCDCVKKKNDAFLVNVCTLKVQQTIFDIVFKIWSFHGLSTKVLHQDRIAIEAKYHRNCLGVYKRRADRAENKTGSEPKQVDPYAEAFTELLQDIEGYQNG